MILAVLMLIQMLPARAETYSDWYQVETETPVVCAVRFVVDGVEISAVSVAEGSRLSSVPEGPARDGYLFIGWYADEQAVTTDTVITADLTAEAVYTEADEDTGDVRKGSSSFIFNDKGTYADITVSGTVKGQEPTVSRNDRVSGKVTVLEAWTVSGLKGNTSLTVEAVITSLPKDGSLSACTMVDGAVGDLVASDLAVGDRVKFDVSAKGAEGIVLTAGTSSGEETGEAAPVEGALYANEHLYLTGKLPKNGVIDVQPVTVSIDGEEVLAAYDISIYGNANQMKKGKTWQPAGQKVRVNWYDASFENRDLNIYHYADGAKAPEFVDTVTAKDGWVEFEVDGFSVYVVTETTYLRTYRFFTFDEYGDYVEYAFYTDNGITTFTQTIKNGETLVAPQNPTNPQDPSATFAGWFEDVREAGTTEPVLADTPYDFSNIPEITQTEEVHLYARFTEYAFVVFHDQYDPDTESFPVAYTHRAELTGGAADVDISAYSVTYHGSGNTMVFTGWSEVPITTPGSDNNDLDEAVVKLGDTISVSGNKELYPIFTPVYWLGFYSGPTGSGATYYPEIYYLKGVGPADLSDHIPTRDTGSSGAYVFAGWYADAVVGADNETVIGPTAVKIAEADGSLVPNASATGISVNEAGQSMTLTADVMLYAAWETIETARYSVLIWKQKASDTPGLANEDKSYEYAERFILSGEVNTNASVDSVYTSLAELSAYNSVHPEAEITSDEENPYQDFEFGRCDASATIVSDGSTVLNVYYDRTEFSTPSSESYDLIFADSVTITENASISLPVAYEGDNKVSYGAPLGSYVPSDPVSGREGYTFTNWYADRECTIRVFFDQDSYGAYTGKKVLYDTMPDHNLTIYAGWEEEWYLVKLDPNYGAMYAYNGSELEGTGSTWFWSTYGGKVQEYTTVTRDYVESASGTYYFVHQSRAFYGFPDTWVDGETAQQERKTYYTNNPGEATEYTTFEYEPGIYRYAGWYEVQDDGTETPYDFGGIIDHNITLKLHWTKVGAFYLVYDSGEGTLDSNEDQETLYVELDGDTYADNADVVVTRIAAPPDGYEFVGWTIRGDDSGVVYTPGSSFTLLTKFAATVQGKKTVYLDAVYSQVPMAYIVYDANGGTITESDLDYGSPVDSASSRPVHTCDTEAGTATISNLVNNSGIYLSDGSGFSRTDATFAGWSNKPVYDPEDETAVLYLPGVQTTETYHVDTSESSVLYAVWEVSVRYHLDRSDASFGSGWGPGYTLTAEDTYTQSVYIGTAAARPTETPEYTGSEGLMFRYWATKDDNGNYALYDFSQPVTEALDLYAYWALPASVPVHAVDATDEALAGKDDWLTTGAMSIGTEPIALDENTASEYAASVPEDYLFAFAAVLGSSAELPDIEESDIAVSLSYNSTDGKVHAVYQNGRDAALAEDDQVYFVYYQEEELSINYVTMRDDGSMEDAAVANGAPSTTGKIGQCDMADAVATPLGFLYDPQYTCYAFVIGSDEASSAKDLSLITSTSDTNDSRPALLVENTWRGFSYSTDNGTTWTSCGYKPTLYVVYFAKKATVVTFTEKTVGLAEDMGTLFKFDYKIEAVVNGEVTGLVYDTTVPGNSPVQLRNGEAYSTILFTDSTTTQRVTVTQTQVEGFVTTDPDGTTSSCEFSYTADDTGYAQEAVFTNTRNTAATVEIHIALVDVANGSITLRDDLRDPDNNGFDLPLGKEAVLPPAGVFSVDDIEYAFGTALYGTNDLDGILTVEGMDIASIACEPVDSVDPNVYGVYLKDSQGERLAEAGSYSIYYLYYPMPVVRYMEEGDAGVLTVIHGSTDGTTVSDTITYEGTVLTLNGKTVEQDQKLEIPPDGLIISQSVGSGSFNMPPLMDKGTDRLYLVYSRIGAGAPDKINTAEISVSDGLTLYLQIRENKLEWSFDESSWTAFTEKPVIYAIYRERGYTLEITKTVPIDTGYREPFTVTISSTAINRTSYSVEGTGYSSVSAVQANGSTTGKITVEVEDGSDIKIFGLGSGTYTLSETGNENYYLTAEQKYAQEGRPAAEDLTVEENSTVTIALDQEKTLALTNTPKVICKVGTRYFHTIQSAVQWIEDNSATFSGTIEMLEDYLMPSSDAPVIPYYLDITLTTAPEYGSGTATITRSGSFASGAMFTNSGVLTLQNITLDGNGDAVTASAAMIDNEGTLTIGSGAVLQNAASSGDGGAVNSWDGSVTVSGGTVSGNSAAQGGAVYASGGTIEINDGSLSGNSADNGGAIYYSGNDAVMVNGGSISDNNAENGGAVYLEKGTLEMTGGSMDANAATENGGAVCAINGEIEVSGGTIGDDTGNHARNGGAIYLESGSVTISGEAVISHNSALENGGGVCTGIGTVTMSGGGLASNSAAEKGGGLYSESGAISIDQASLSGNSSTAGNGGGVYAGTGSVSLNAVTLAGNTAEEGFGGGLYTGSGAAVLTSCTFNSGNTAMNGAAVYTNTGSVTFSDGTITNNTATAGGAVGIGSNTARLYFKGNVSIKNNTMGTETSNVYLDQDSDAVINATGLGSGASIGIYVPDKNVTVTDISGVTSTADLFDRRGVPGAFFATYTSDTNISKFSNDRLPGLSIQKETTTKRLYWGKAFTVRVRYLESFSYPLNTVAEGVAKKVDNKDPFTYYAPSSRNAASEIADDLRSAHTISGLSTSAVFAVAFVGTDRSFANYITDVNWDSANNSWSFIKRDGTEITGDTLVVYFSEPAYIQIENNTEYPLDVSTLTVLGQSVVNSDSSAGYGYVFAVNGVLQNSLRPVTAEDLTLQRGKNIKLLFPGGKNADWNLPHGGFTDASEAIPYKLDGTSYELSADEVSYVSLNGTTLNTNGGTYNIVFGGKSAICRIVTAEISGVSESEIAGNTDTPDAEGKVEYTFSTLNQAVAFAKNHTLKDATIEMLVDYLIPASDVVDLPEGYNFTFTTATSGTYKYSDDPNARATISRDQGNNASFITSANGRLVSNDYNTSLKVENLVFDGKNFGGSSISGGIVKTKGCNVEIDNVDFRNCVARFGGGIYIESVNKNSSSKTPYGSLKVTNTTFTGCQSQETGDKFGGGAIWTSMKNVTIENSRFTNCQAVAQAGAVFHYVGGNFTTTTTITGCTFEGCQSKAAGSLESGAKTVTITGCTFRDSKATERNGGAVNVYALDNANPAVSTQCSVKLEDCTFENCYCVVGNNGNGNGGALRSTAVNNEVINCRFTNATGVQGGAIAISNSNADTAIFTNCQMDNCTATNTGGGIYCTAKTFRIDGDANSITNCKATNEGGAIYHGRNASGSSLSIEGLTIDSCSSIGKAGGGVYSTAQTVSISDATVKNCTSPAQGGGLCLVPGSSSGSNRSVTVTNSVIQGNEASGNGGGIYTNAVSVNLTETSVADNTATGSGGGVCHNLDSANGRLTLDSCTVSGNTGEKGGGTYTLANMTIRNNTSVSGNHLSTDTATDAAGVYLRNGRILTVGTEDAATPDASRVTGNLTLGGNPSNLRLSQQSTLTSNNSINSVDVLCNLSGEFRVIDAYSKGTQFGSTEVSTQASPVYTIGFSDLNHVFIADDDSLYGIIDRADPNLKKIIWAGEPICKITDDRGRLLYLDTSHEFPAVFDRLDDGSSTATTAFSVLRYDTPPLYYADGTLYTGSTYQVKMLVENYTATKMITTPDDTGRTIILTTAGSGDSQYPYRGRSGTRSTVTRGTAVGNNPFITAKSNLTLTNIVLDGGSESGVTAKDKTRIIYSEKTGATITLGRNAALQNASTTGNGNGGAVYLNNASLIIEGGVIRNCSAANGGAVYKNGTNGCVTFTGGSITRCTATGNGGGVYINGGPAAQSGDSFVMTGGSITRCTAKNGGGVWVHNDRRMSMSGGSISANSASTAGGGIMVGNNKARLYFSGAAFVYGNTCEASLAPSKASNVQMNQDFPVTANNPNNPGTIIHTTGLSRGATIGVYVPEAQYKNHGDFADPFATYEGTPAGFNYFINDRNGLKGGLMEGQAVGTDMKIYWRQIYTLEINLEVLSRANSDKEKDFHFTVTLSEEVGGVQWNEVNETYGDLQFQRGVATFTLNGSTKTSTMADLLPLGYGYTVTMDPADAAGYAVYPDVTQSGAMNEASQFLYTVNFRVVRDVVCKITDETYGLLYFERGGVYVEAVYDALVSAFNRVNMGDLYYKVGDTFYEYSSNDHRIEMLIPSYDMKEATALSAGRNVILTTADPNADDGFPYAGGSSTAVINRAYDGTSMITVNGNLTLDKITLDGNRDEYPVSCDGGAVAVNKGGTLAAGTGATLQNSTTTGSGAAVYLAEGSTMEVSGNPEFSNNISTGASLPDDAQNGGVAYAQAHQDIYIAGYGDETAVSLHVTGDLTGDRGSIWVWAAESPHHKQSKQFAVMSGGTYSGLDVFRNARTDEDTENPLTTTPKYLYGVRRRNDEYVYWSGGADLTVTKSVTGQMGDITREFTFKISGLPEGKSYQYTKYTTTDGTTWTEAEDGGGTLTSSANEFTLKHHERIVIEDLPVNTLMTIEETNKGYYTATWRLGSAEPAEAASTPINLTEDSELSVTNDLPAVAPTGYHADMTPFLLLLLAGMLLLRVGRKQRGGDAND